MYSTWQFLSLSDVELCELSFALYNSSNTGLLRKDEMKELYYYIYGCSQYLKIDDRVMYAFEVMAYSNRQALTKEEYLFNLAEVPELVTPFFTLRDKLRKVILGAKFWKKIEPQAYL